MAFWFLLYLHLMLCLSNSSAEENVVFRFARNYGSNMVLQRAPLHAVLWGFGEEGQEVKVNISHINQILKGTVIKGMRHKVKLACPLYSAWTLKCLKYSCIVIGVYLKYGEF